MKLYTISIEYDGSIGTVVLSDPGMIVPTVQATLWQYDGYKGSVEDEIESILRPEMANGLTDIEAGRRLWELANERYIGRNDGFSIEQHEVPGASPTMCQFNVHTQDGQYVPVESHLPDVQAKNIVASLYREDPDNFADAIAEHDSVSIIYPPTDNFHV